ncbi:hypothetical protein A6C57_04600 [Fibrella sp. ES10-3-2-2]
MKERLLLVALLLSTSSTHSLAQLPNLRLSTVPKKSSFYFSWGYNHEAYSRSTIRFRNTTTDNYDFTIVDAHAHESPDMADFWRITYLTIPQYQMNGGYFFNNKNGWGIELSWDHLKYTVDDYQTVRLQGNIRGRTIDKDTLLTPSFLHLQHTNGNNYLMINAVKKWPVWQGKHLSLDAITKAGVGPLISVTISTIMGSSDSKGHFRPQGWVAGTSAGLKLTIYNRLFVQGDGQLAFANYTGAEIGADRVGRATHHFFSYAYMYRVGMNFPL